MKKTLRYVICDVFTDTPLTGNPLAVFTDARGLSSETMQRLAREMNLSETTFVLPREADGHAKVRIFTPHMELPFAGHPTLGTAFVLGGAIELETLRLELGIGTVPVTLEREGPRVRFGWMVQPVPKRNPCEDEAALLAALGVQRSELPVQLFDNGPLHACVALESHAAVAALRPNLEALAKLRPNIVSAFHYDGTSCKTRVFAPAAGVPEDPATGSAAGPVAWHLLCHGRLASGEELFLEQGTECGRPSKLYARVTTDAEHGEETPRIEVGGSAVVVARGEFSLRGL